jgi:hypothetical protein
MREIAHRRALLARLLRATGAGSLGACLASTMGTGCGGEVSGNATSTSSGSGTTGSSGHASSTTSSGGTTSQSSGHGGTSSTFSSSAPFDAGGDSSDGGDAGACGPVQVCFPVGDGGACATPASLVGTTAFTTACPGMVGLCPGIDKVLSGPFIDGGTACCYFVEGMPIPCYVGRTFYLDEGAVKAELRRGRSWRAGPRPEVSLLPAATRRALGDAWARDGLFEHASVASFSRFSMELLALGAPADLVRDTHAACVDEVRHAELCLALASAYLGHDVEPSRLPFASAVVVGGDLAAIAAESALEGCVGETVAAVQAYESLLRATDPAVREVLAVTVEDETRHAELAWRFLAWALDTGGPDVRESVMRAFAGFRPAPPTPENLDGVDMALFEAHGRIEATDARAIADRALADVVRPCLCALLDSRPRPETVRPANPQLVAPAPAADGARSTPFA